MENNIEEDIKILEEFKTNGYSILLMKYGDRIKTNFKLEKAIEHILSNYKRVLKENEELRAKWDKDTHILQNKLDYANADRIDLAQQNKELRKENEELNYKLHSKKIALEIYNRYIPKSKVKEKIEELDKEEKRELKGTKGQDRYYIKQKYMYKRKVLEDLLREE